MINFINQIDKAVYVRNNRNSMVQHQYLKKQGLLTIIESYLTQSTRSCLQFLARHIPSTQDLAANLGSHVEHGLSYKQLEINQQFYGKNKLQVDQQLGIQRFCKIFTSQLFRLRTAFIILMIIFEIVCSNVWEIYEMNISCITICIAIAISWVLRIFVHWRQKLIEEDRIHLNEPNTVYVYRSGEKISVTEDELTVGDLVFVDYSQTIPATGILISSQEIELDQTKYGKGVQSKLPLEDCLQNLSEKNELQLRMDIESGALPSPIVIRGVKNTTDRTFKMMVLAVDEHYLLERQKSSKSHEQSISSVQLWIGQATQTIKKVSSVILVIILFFHLLALIFKIKGLPKGQFIPFATTLIETLQALICLTLLLDVALCSFLLKGTYLQVAGMLGTRQNIDRFLAVQQIFLNEESICKYDSIIPKKVALADLHESVDIRLLPALKPEKTYAMIYEVLAGVGLQEGLTAPNSLKFHRNTIIHFISLQERVFSSLYATYPQKNKHQGLIQEGDSLSEIARTQGQLLLRQCNSNRITPESQIQEISKRSHSLQSAFHDRLQDKIVSEEIKDQEILKEGRMPQDCVRLQEFLSKQCHFSTRNILQGIQKLAKNVSRTYFFQKFSMERLSQIKLIWAEGRFYPAETERQQQIMLSAKRLEKEGLVPYLIGFDQGAFSKKYMTYLLGVLGVEVIHNEQLVSKLHQLEQIGIHTLFTLQQHEEQKFTGKQRLLIQKQFIERRWALSNHRFRSMEAIKSQGGRIICCQCLSSRCKCKLRKEELADPQGFLGATNEVRCIWKADQSDLKYLEKGFEQLGMTTLRLIDHREDVPHKLDQIIAGNEMFHAIQQNLALWIVWLSSVSLCFFPFNYLTFDNILGHPQLYVALIYFQILLARHHVAGSSTFIRTESLTSSKRKRQMLGIALKVDIVLFVVCITAGCYLCLSNPLWFSGNVPRLGIAGFDCKQVRSYYHNPSIAKAICMNNVGEAMIYSKVGTFIFIFILLSFTFRSALTVRQPFSKANIMFHSILAGLLILISYTIPEALQLAYNGLSVQELGICLGAALGVVCFSFLCRVGVMKTEGGKIFHFEVRVGQEGNEYAQLLKEHKQGRYSQFPLEKQAYTPQL